MSGTMWQSLNKKEEVPGCEIAAREIILWFSILYVLVPAALVEIF